MRPSSLSISCTLLSLITPDVGEGITTYCWQIEDIIRFNEQNLHKKIISADNVI